MSGWVVLLALLGLAGGVQVLALVLVLLNRVLRPLREIKAYADNILEAGRGIAKNLDGIDEAQETRELALVLSGGVRGSAGNET
ncbi:MAG TPA: hypothetical protein VE615_05110 [Gaiellaceae bacterium]|jgi:HAMP domain-containing protein|nr:hypothetical protein [Gaiellaceae bacterium]